MSNCVPQSTFATYLSLASEFKNSSFSPSSKACFIKSGKLNKLRKLEREINDALVVDLGESSRKNSLSLGLDNVVREEIAYGYDPFSDEELRSSEEESEKDDHLPKKEEVNEEEEEEKEEEEEEVDEASSAGSSSSSVSFPPSSSSSSLSSSSSSKSSNSSKSSINAPPIFHSCNSVSSRESAKHPQITRTLIDGLISESAPDRRKRLRLERERKRALQRERSRRLAGGEVGDDEAAGEGVGVGVGVGFEIPDEVAIPTAAKQKQNQKQIKKQTQIHDKLDDHHSTVASSRRGSIIMQRSSTSDSGKEAYRKQLSLRTSTCVHCKLSLDFCVGCKKYVKRYFETNEAVVKKYNRRAEGLYEHIKSRIDSKGKMSSTEEYDPEIEASVGAVLRYLSNQSKKSEAKLRASNRKFDKGEKEFKELSEKPYYRDVDLSVRKEENLVRDVILRTARRRKTIIIANDDNEDGMLEDPYFDETKIG